MQGSPPRAEGAVGERGAGVRTLYARLHALIRPARDCAAAAPSAITLQPRQPPRELLVFVNEHAERTRCGAEFRNV